MSSALASVENSFRAPERRLHTRQHLRLLAYVVLDEGNGGIILNISEGGFSIQAVTSLVEDSLPGVRFQLPQSREWIETGARIGWRGESKKLAGLAFVDLPEEARGRIREWVSREAALDPHPSEPARPADENGRPIKNSAPGPGAKRTTSTSKITSLSLPLAEPTANRSFGWTRDSSLNLDGPIASRAPQRKEAHRNHAAIATLITFLALGSLVAGWEVGRSGWDRTIQRVGRLAWHTRASAPEAPPVASVAAPVSTIEIVDANNQRWTIPFQPPEDLTEESPRQKVTAVAVPQSGKPRIVFRTWVLTPPHRAGDSVIESRTDNPNPPAVSDSSDSPSNIDPSKWADSSSLPPPPPASARSSEGPATTVTHGALIHRVDPVYPALAREQRVEGTVKFHVTVADDGTVRSVALLGGPSLLLEAARSAVRQWRYSPTLVNGRPVETQRDISLVFHLSQSSN